MYKSDEIIIAGFGGQGVLSMGQTLAYAAMFDNKETSWMPSYGPEMRGGTANCIVIISEGPISSPIISKYDSGIILNQPSMEKFEAAIKPGGVLIYEASTVITAPTRTDITVLKIAAIEEANKMNKKQIANMIMLGAFLEMKPLVALESVLGALKKVLPERHHHTIPLNEKAILRGKEMAAEQLNVHA
ncbi:MAG: 2-oxoacid:acceptor oxidoreductase family protein [Ignavibacteriaceae bacterium]|nr:2-oxoacid:acceptor oxidoreductase family protein [Ignavibacteriaceae bacterium]